MLTKPAELVAPLLHDLQRYDKRLFRADLIAGASVAMVALPQSMAYAMIAKVPPVYGLYAAIVQGLIAAFFTSSSHLSTGPVNAMSLLIGSAIGTMALSAEERVPFAILLTFLVGTIQIGCYLMKIGALVRYISHEVIVGFTAGAGILIAVQQIPHFLGVRTAEVRSTLPGELLPALEKVYLKINDANLNAILIGIGTMALVLIGRRISKFIPGPLIAVILSALVVALMGWNAEHLPVVGQIVSGLPGFAMPDLASPQVRTLITAAVAISLVGVLEAYSIAKAVAVHTGENIQPDREFLAQGAANFTSSFFQCIPGSGSLSRTAFNYQAGARTRFAGVYCSLLVAAIFLLLADYARHIPLSCLAAILFIIAYGLIDWKHIQRIARSSRSDFMVCMVTLICCLVIPLEFAIFVGVLLNIAAYLRRTSTVHIAEMVTQDSGAIVERPLIDAQGNKSVVVLQVEGNLFFGVADELRERLTSVAQSGARVIVLRLKRAHSIDATILHELEQFARMMQSSDRHVLLCGIRPDLMQRMQNYGLLTTLGPHNVFPAATGIFTSMKNALNRARTLVGASIDTTGLDMADELGNWYYQI